MAMVIRGIAMVIFLFLLAVSARTRTSCGETFCESSSTYPLSSSHQKSLENDSKLKSLKGLPRPRGSSSFVDDDPGLQPGVPLMEVCKSKSNLIFPQEALNTRGERRFIINFGPFKQGLNIERCRSESNQNPCNYVGSPPGYRSVCVQMETEHRLTVVESDSSSGQVQTGVDIFRFPSYCACKLVQGQGRETHSICPPVPISPQPTYDLVAQRGPTEVARNQNLQSRAGYFPGSSTYQLAPQPVRLTGRSQDLFTGSQRNVGYPTSSENGFNGGLPFLIH